MNAQRISLKDAQTGRYRILKIAPDAMNSVTLKKIPLSIGDIIEILFSSERSTPTVPLPIVLPNKQLIFDQEMAQSVCLLL